MIAAVGVPMVGLRGSVDLPVHVTVPITAPAGAELVLTLRVSGLTGWEVHVAPYGLWQCAEGPGASGRLTCTLTADGVADDLGIDLAYDGSASGTATLDLVGTADPDLSDNRADLVLPTLA